MLPLPPVTHAGTGKTLLAKAIAAEGGVRMFTCSGTDFYDVYRCAGVQTARRQCTAQ